MDKSLFLWLFGVLGILYIVIGYRASRSITTIDDYFLAGRHLGLFALTIALIATQLGGGVILGTSKESYTQGLYGIAYVIGISIGFIILALGLAGKFRSLNIHTTAEIFQIRYNSIALRKFASLLSMISLIGILAAQVVASRNLMISLDVYSEWLFVAFWVLIIGYTMLGGLKAVVNNDIFQLSFIVMVFASIFVYEIISNPLSVKAIFSSHHALGITLSWRLLSILLIPAFYCLIEQDIAQTLFAARSPSIAIMGTLLSSLFMISFALIPAFFGMKAHFLGLAIPESANPLIYLLDRSYPTALMTLIIYGIFAAIISTADALLCAISSHMVQDFNLTQKSTHALWIAKGATLAIGIVTLILGHYYNNIIDVLVGSYTIPVAALFVPLMAPFILKKVYYQAAWASIAIGLSSYCILKLIGADWPIEIISLALATMCYALVTIFYSKSNLATQA
ncbi:MAG TPA: sodium:solute symporter family protein [Candidatus Babeliaceae bacterium]|nr:sodium:solute symporter family protein [Candidatus Babeliaceae bacterium]